MAKYKMKPCPFCSSSEIRADRLLGSNRLYHVKCSTCGSAGPLFEEFDSAKKGMEGSVNLWNNRFTVSNQD